MGCDIHLVLERKRKGNCRWEQCGILGYDCCWGDRVYGMFAALADVRNYTGIEHLPLRGFPKDATRATLLLYGYEVVDKQEYDWQMSRCEAERWVGDGASEYMESDGVAYCSDSDWHSANWCGTAEMEECIHRVFGAEDGGLKGDFVEWLALLGAMKGYEQGGYECRAVYWFDN